MSEHAVWPPCDAIHLFGGSPVRCDRPALHAERGNPDHWPSVSDKRRVLDWRPGALPLHDDTSECEEGCAFGPPHRGTCLVPERHSARCRGGVCGPECPRIIGPREADDRGRRPRPCGSGRAHRDCTGIGHD